MRDSNDRSDFTGIYARIRELPINQADRDHAVQALLQAERVADALGWIREKLAALGNAFLKPSLKH